ncbi:glyoxalase/bleomycin resistance protein/dioxygenase [Aaosphaeria arxii CBS 175.79]|uniref:Bleomycin resistance protein n=1 Tax=Aaosphaeria arxii CBS 175.79 TaxID=1450172 RepID=A0A6A5XJW9_9PLEO|nr:glyoxalase/bleomycin resistance protein/dioxygenase [Aaosphaeria arxii CBS 175.79]KAF2012604.1 glyoxalase/bleomycin resistance protein/dioxygenase [Aaosphaeria arxii CBS 175.79]
MATIQFHTVTPILRIFSIPKADEFYLDYLGFTTDWSHRFSPDLPLYRQVSRGGLVLHLSEHHGDGSPGVHVRVTMTGLEAFHAELEGKKYGYLRPGIEEGHAEGAREMAVMDPFGNRITFCEGGES